MEFLDMILWHDFHFELLQSSSLCTLSLPGQVFPGARKRMHPRILNLSRSAGAGALFRNVPDRRKGVDRIDLPDTLSERGLLRVLQNYPCKREKGFAWVPKDKGLARPPMLVDVEAFARGFQSARALCPVFCFELCFAVFGPTLPGG